jgi:hypothetical protein
MLKDMACSPSPRALPVLMGDLDLDLVAGLYVEVDIAEVLGFLRALAVFALNPAETRLLVEVFFIRDLIFNIYIL